MPEGEKPIKAAPINGTRIKTLSIDGIQVRGAGGQGSRGAGEQGSRGAGEQGSRGRVKTFNS